jgi:GGDEF domain-containing protein
LKSLADMVVGEMLRQVDTEAGWSDRVAQTTTAAKFFNSIPDERDLSVLLFDIDDVLSSHDDDNSRMSPGEIFAQLLHDHFPTALSIVHLGEYHFCVLIKSDRSFDEVRAISRLCSDAKNLLCFADGHESLTPFVGRIQYDSNKYASADNVLHDAERMFLRHERQPLPGDTEIKQFLKELVGWRKTIF